MEKAVERQKFQTKDILIKGVGTMINYPYNYSWQPQLLPFCLYPITQTFANFIK